MKKSIIGFSAMCVIAATILFGNGNSRLPKGWFSSGNNPIEYEMGVDTTVAQSGKSSAFIKSKSPEPNDFGTLAQITSAENYIAKRLRLSGYIKSDSVKGWCGMWMRIDGENKKELGFDNMKERAIKGTTDWTKYEIVLDVPSSSKAIGYGVLLNGKGMLWFDNMKLEVVDKSVPVTKTAKEITYPKDPVNLNFEE
jgi:hypothetical protein